MSKQVEYSRIPCFKDCWGDGINNAHYHAVDPNVDEEYKMIRKLNDDSR